MWMWELLFMNGCECKSDDFYHGRICELMQTWDNSSMWLEVLLKNNDTWVE
jgi:hypothetical protein